MSDVPDKVRRIVHERDGGRCVRCSREAHHVHHRQFRSRGGKHQVVNLILLCFGCHDLIHSYSAIAERAGWALPAGADPATAAVLYHDGTYRFLTEEGYFRMSTEESAHACS